MDKKNQTKERTSKMIESIVFEVLLALLTTKTHQTCLLQNKIKNQGLPFLQFENQPMKMIKHTYKEYPSEIRSTGYNYLSLIATGFSV